jgi:hypothetical protein
MAKIDSLKGKEQKGFRYSEIPGRPTNGLNLYLLVSLVKGIVWLVKTPIKWIIKKVKSKQ